MNTEHEDEILGNSFNIKVRADMTKENFENLMTKLLAAADIFEQETFRVNFPKLA